jgi:hypothetical protein
LVTLTIPVAGSPVRVPRNPTDVVTLILDASAGVALGTIEPLEPRASVVSG